MKSQSYDYIIVGAGSAGCVLAARLSEDPSTRVLLLEAGPGDCNPLISIPIGMGKLHRHELYQWGDSSEPEPLLAGRRMPVAHGKVLGGSSSINMMAYTRGNPADYDRWEELGARGWSYSAVLPYFKKSETWEGGEDPFRGGNGVLGTQWARTTDPIYDAWIRAGEENGFAFTLDYNGAQPEGFGRGQYTIRDGRRSSTSRAFLRPSKNRANLTIATGAMTTRIVCEKGRASGVEYLSKTGKMTANADREVIISAGAINSPQLLMLSGIGPKEHLAEMGIRTLIDLPVGKNLQDHLGVGIGWERTSPGAFHKSLRYDRAAINMLRAYFQGEGPATSVPGGLHAFIKSEPSVAYANIEIMFYTATPQADVWFPGIKPAYQDGYGIRPTLLRPKSRGYLRLKSTDPKVRPSIVYRMLSEMDDRHSLREGFKRAQEIGNSNELAPYRGRLSSPSKRLLTDQEIDEHITNTAMTLLHPVGTCKMGSDDTAVIDAKLKVRGIDGLRVVDGSVMPDLVSAHINAAIIMIAEKAADMIKKPS